MFKNIGKKIMALAKALCWFGIVLSLIAGACVAVMTAESGIDTVFAVASGLLAAAVGALFSWIASFLLYGFGQLVDDTADIRRKIAAGNGTPSKTE